MNSEQIKEIIDKVLLKFINEEFGNRISTFNMTGLKMVLMTEFEKNNKVEDGS